MLGWSAKHALRLLYPNVRILLNYSFHGCTHTSANRYVHILSQLLFIMLTPPTLYVDWLVQEPSVLRTDPPASVTAQREHQKTATLEWLLPSLEPTDETTGVCVCVVPSMSHTSPPIITIVYSSTGGGVWEVSAVTSAHQTGVSHTYTHPHIYSLGSGSYSSRDTLTHAPMYAHTRMHARMHTHTHTHTGFCLHSSRRSVRHWRSSRRLHQKPQQWPRHSHRLHFVHSSQFSFFLCVVISACVLFIGCGHHGVSTWQCVDSQWSLYVSPGLFCVHCVHWNLLLLFYVYVTRLHDTVYS